MPASDLNNNSQMCIGDKLATVDGITAGMQTILHSVRPLIGIRKITTFFSKTTV